jgi:hypothetical protein
MKLKLSKHWYEDQAKAEEKCMDVAAGISLRGIAKKAPARKSKKSTAARTALRAATSSKRRAK